MTLEFDFSNVNTVEFGVGKDNGDDQVFVCIPVDGDVQGALREMTEATWQQMQKQEVAPRTYEPSEQYRPSEYLQLAITDALATKMRDLHQANNLPIDSNALADTKNVYCYFARMTDQQARRISALRRASQFKGIIKSRLIRLVTDALKLVEDKVFKLDSDFDLLIDATTVHIFRPSSFEFAGKLQAAVLAAVPTNIAAIRRNLGFVNFSTVEEYASKHPRAARYLASIRSQADLRRVDKSALRKLCRDTSVKVSNSKGKITVDESSVMGFLEVLDRRRYRVELVKGSGERFKAGSRRKIED